MLQCCAGQRLDIMLHMTCLVRRSAVENRLPVVNHLQLLFTFQRPHLSHGFVRVYNFFFCRFNISYHIFDGTGFHSVIYHCWRHSKRCENDKREKGRRGATRTLKSLGRFGTFNYNAVTFLNFFTKCCEMCGLERPRLSICPSHSQFTYNNSKSTYAKFIYFIVIRAGRQ